MGDFNTMLFPHDGVGGSSRRNNDMEDFFLCLEDVEIFDVTYTGIQYTWCQKPSGGCGINRKLDRVMANTDFLSLYADANAHFLPRSVSDHSPGLLRFNGGCGRKPWGFKFDNMVATHPSFLHTVANSWSMQVVGSALFVFLKRLKGLKRPLRILRSHFGEDTTRLVDLRSELLLMQSACDADPDNPLLLEDLAHLMMAFQRAKEDEEVFYKQRAKVKWLNEGDGNKRFFHRAVMERRATNFISSVCDSDGNFHYGDEVPQTFIDYFQGVLGEEDSAVTPMMDQALFDRRLTLHESLEIIKPFTNDEIKSALFSIGIDKAPGSDGFSSLFFKSAWPIIGKDFLTAIHSFFYTSRLEKEVNHTLVSLVPKCPNASKVTDFRPFACCSVIYKTISKILADRMKGYLNFLISLMQSAFIPGRLISDNILMAHELVAGYQRGTGPPRCAFKIDIRKAYDTVNWDYLIAMMEGFGFHIAFVKWLKVMITTSSFSLVINGSSEGFFRGKRGIRQGDPISPCLP